MKFSSFFSFLYHSDLNSRSEFLIVRKRIQFEICSFSSSTLKMNFDKKNFNLCKMNLSAWIKFSSFFSFLRRLAQPLHMNFSQFERELNSASSHFLFLLRWRIFHKKNFNYMKGEFVCKNEIFLIFQVLLQFRPRFSIWISDSLKYN